MKGNAFRVGTIIYVHILQHKNLSRYSRDTKSLGDPLTSKSLCWTRFVWNYKQPPEQFSSFCRSFLQIIFLGLPMFLKFPVPFNFSVSLSSVSANILCQSLTESVSACSSIILFMIKTALKSWSFKLQIISYLQWVLHWQDSASGILCLIPAKYRLSVALKLEKSKCNSKSNESS